MSRPRLTIDAMDPALRPFLWQLSATTALPTECEYLCWIRVNRASLLDDWQRAGLPHDQLCAWLRSEFNRCHGYDSTEFSAVPGSSRAAPPARDDRGPSEDLSWRAIRGACRLGLFGLIVCAMWAALVRWWLS